MRCGLTNTVALEGAKVPDSIKRLTKEREATALLDGDRGGDLILKELLQVTNVKYVGRAPRGKEIEECNCKEIAEALDNRVPVAEIQKQQTQQQQPISHQSQLQPPQQSSPQKKPMQQAPQPSVRVSSRPPKRSIPDQIKESVKTLQGTLEAVLLNDKLEQIERLPVSQLAEKLQQVTDVNTIIFDGIITQRIVDIAAEKAAKQIVASRVSEAVKPVTSVELITFQEALH
jgi:DNA primase